MLQKPQGGWCFLQVPSLKVTSTSLCLIRCLCYSVTTSAAYWLNNSHVIGRLPNQRGVEKALQSPTPAAYPSPARGPVIGKKMPVCDN